MAFFNKRLGFEKSTEDLFGKPKAKKFNYSSEMNAIVLERALQDAADLSGSTVSYVIENLITERFIPANAKAAHYATKVYFGKTIDVVSSKEYKYGIREALVEIFAEESMGTSFRSRHADSRDLVELARNVMRKNQVRLDPDADPLERHEAISDWGSICRVLESECEDQKSRGINHYELQTSARYGREYESALKNDEYFSLSATADFILHDWDTLSNSTFTFRFLSSALAVSTPWDDTPEDRKEFASACQRVMSEWAIEDMKKEEHEKKEREDAQLVEYNMADESILICPKGWLIANPEEGPSSKWAIVLEVKNGEPYDAPHVLFFTNTPPEEKFSLEEHAEALRAMTSAWPRLAEVMADEVKLEYGPDGGITNMKEYAVAPAIGLFCVYEKGKNPLGKAPFGACIIRAGKEGTN